MVIDLETLHEEETAVHQIRRELDELAQRTLTESNKTCTCDCSNDAVFSVCGC